ncbi:MAG: hypothetical protein LBJ32_02875 [Oscillospiraceae bacterium]|jgi:hypothetical protein|nr:hypothetical protein [Oscillospiraceae bacterium]
MEDYYKKIKEELKTLSRLLETDFVFMEELEKAVKSAKNKYKMGYYNLKIIHEKNVQR